MFTATAPGKVILFGEHAVVYGHPALAAPVVQLRARATVEETGRSDVALIAPDLNRSALLSKVHAHNPLAAVVRVVEQYCNCSLSDGYSLSVTSAIPIASGLGSGAAISVAVIRAWRNIWAERTRSRARRSRGWPMKSSGFIMARQAA